MTIKLKIALLLILLGLPCHIVEAQESAAGNAAGAPAIAEPDERMMAAIEGRLQAFIDDISTLVVLVSTSPEDSLSRMERAYNYTNARWQTFYQAQQMDIATDEELMNMVAKYQITCQTVEEELEKLKARAEALKAYKTCYSLINKEAPQYKKLYKEAMALSMVQKLAPKLEQLKAKEQLKFATIQSSFEKAKAGMADNADYKQRMDKLEEQYVKLQNISAKIQAAEYKPLLVRIKDELMGLACVAIIIMFFNMVVNKLQALKKARDAAKQYGDMFQNNQQYPTI